MDEPVLPLPPTGPLAGLRIVELSHERTAWAAKLCADMGAEVILVEPVGGSTQRGYGPFAGDEPGDDRSLWWWHYNTSKLGVVLDLANSAEDRDRLATLIEDADAVLEGEDPGFLASLGIDVGDLRGRNQRLVWLSLTPFGRSGPRHDEVATDLTILAAGGPVWSCGYDDHSIAPVRGGGNQGFQIGGHFAVMSLLTALLWREESGRGQFIDVNLHAAANVTTEFASYGWLVAEWIVMRQTGRHATPSPSQPTQVLCGDGRYANTGVPPRRAAEFRSLLDWLHELGFADEFPETAVLELGLELDRISLADIDENPLLGEVFGAARDAVMFIAERIGAYEYFVGSQERGMPAGIIYSPEEVIEDPHFVARGWPTEVHHPELGRSFTYPGVPIRFNGSPAQIRGRAPRLGEHQDLVFGG